MRCSCPECGEFMIHSETAEACVCPNCLRRCSACLGTDSVLPREAVLSLKRGADRADEARLENEISEDTKRA